MKLKEFRDADYNFYPNSNNKNMIYIKNVVKAKNIHIGEFTYYDSHGKVNVNFERDNILYNFPGHGDLYIGKFCSLAYGIEIIMGAANHSTKSFSTYTFSLISDNWAKRLGMTKEDMPPIKDTVIGNDVWIGRKSRIMPGVKIGNGAIIGGYSVVSKDVPAYCVAVGSPIKIIKKRFDDDTIEFLEKIKWWNFKPKYLEEAITYLSTIDLENAKIKLAEIAEKNEQIN